MAFLFVNNFAKITCQDVQAFAEEDDVTCATGAACCVPEPGGGGNDMVAAATRCIKVSLTG